MEHKECGCTTCGPNNGYHAVIQTYERKRDSLIPILHEIQARAGRISDEAMEEVADWLDVPVSEVHGTATFYTLFSTETKGRYIIRLCDSPPCHIEGSKSIKAAIQKEIGVEPGQTTDDGNFTFELVSCFGLCGVAPAVMINEEVYGNLTPEMMPDIINKYRNKES